VSWIWRDNIPLTDTANIKVENIDYHTDFSIVTTSRKDSGRYTIVAENKSGKDTETVELTVLGKQKSQK
jgi:Immunoglobulin I-set domain